MAAPLCHPATAPQLIPEGILAILAMVDILATTAATVVTAIMVDMRLHTVHPPTAPQLIPEGILAILAMVDILATTAATVVMENMVDMHPHTVHPHTLLVTVLLPTALPHILEATALPLTVPQHTLLQRTLLQPPLILLQPPVMLAMDTVVPMGHHLLRLSAMEATLDTVQDMPLPPPIPLATVVLLRMVLPHTLELGMEQQAWMLLLLAMQPPVMLAMDTVVPMGHHLLRLSAMEATLDTVQDMPLPPPIPLATVVLLRMVLPHTLELGMEQQAWMLLLLAMLPQCQLPTVPATVLRLLPQLLPQHMPLAVSQHKMPLPE